MKIFKFWKDIFQENDEKPFFQAVFDQNWRYTPIKQRN